MKSSLESALSADLSTSAVPSSRRASGGLENVTISVDLMIGMQTLLCIIEIQSVLLKYLSE